MTQGAFESLHLRWDRQEDFSDDELARILVDPDPAIRVLAKRIAFEQAMRPAMDALAVWLAIEGRIDRESDWLAQGSSLARYYEPVPHLLKASGLRALERNELGTALKLLLHAMATAMREGQRGDPRSRRLMRYALDRDIDRAYEAIAARISAPRYYTTRGERMRVAVLIPFDQDGNSVSLAGTALAVGLTQLGMDAFVVTTGMIPSPPDSAQQRRLREVGSRLVAPSFLEPLDAIEWLLEFFEREPVDAVLYFSDPQDAAPRICEIIGLANVQIFINGAYEHRTGRLDACVQTVEPRQVERSLRPEIAVFIPSGIVRDQAVMAASPAPREVFGIAGDAVVLCTFGRIAKLAQRGFLEAVTTILREEPKAIWLVAGSGTPEENAAITDTLAVAGVQRRAILLGNRGDGIPELLKMSDVYLDPFPFPGAQSTGEAMFAGLPVVSMKRTRDADLDATEVGPTTAAAEAMLGDETPMAESGDIAGYVRLARCYIADREQRLRAGAVLRDRAQRLLKIEDVVKRFRDLIHRAVATREPLKDGELTAVIVVPSQLPIERIIGGLQRDRGLYAASRVVVAVPGTQSEFEQRLQRYGDQIRIVFVKEDSALDEGGADEDGADEDGGFEAGVRAGVAAATSNLCAVLDGRTMPGRGWASEGVAAARRSGWGLVKGGVVLDRERGGALEAALRELRQLAETPSGGRKRDEPVPDDELFALQARYDARVDFSQAELAALSAHPDERARNLARRVDFEQKIRPAFAAALRLARDAPEMAVDIVRFTSAAVWARSPETYVGAMKLRAEDALAHGDVETALTSASAAIRVGTSAGVQGIKSWFGLLGVASDPEWNEILRACAAKISAPRTYPAREKRPLRFAVVVSFDYEANSLALVAAHLAIGFRNLGYDVVYVSTEYYESHRNSQNARSMRGAGVEMVRVEGATHLDRVTNLLDLFARSPADAVLYVVDPADPIARMTETIRLSNAQALVMAGFDQGPSGIDAFVYTVEERQLKNAVDAQRSTFIPTGIARDRAILATRPVQRSDIGLSPQDVVLCTVARLTKSVQPEFLAAMVAALKKHRNAKWLLLGQRDEQALGTLNRALAAGGVGGQVQWPGAVHNELPAYLLVADIYCDTFPFSGGQSLGEAMFAALPVVTMRRGTGSGPTWAAAEAFIGDTVELVPAGDVRAYTEKISSYVLDPHLRKRDGERLRERAKTVLSFDDMVRRYSQLLESLATRAPVVI